MTLNRCILHYCATAVIRHDLWFEHEGTTGLGNLSSMLLLHLENMYEMLRQPGHPLCVVSPPRGRGGRGRLGRTGASAE